MADLDLAVDEFINYLAAEKGSIPELKRVIVAYANQIAMDETFDASLQALFGRRPAVAAGRTPEPRPPGLTGDTGGGLVERAWEAWTRAQEALKRGDWGAYGEAQRRLEDALKALRDRPAR